MVLSNAGNHAEAINISRQALNIAEGTTDEVLIGKAHFNLGLAYNDARELSKARSEFEKSLAIREKVLPKDDADVGRTLICLARVMKGEQATTIMDRARGVFQKRLAP